VVGEPHNRRSDVEAHEAVEVNGVSADQLDVVVLVLLVVARSEAALECRLEVFVGAALLDAGFDLPLALTAEDEFVRPSEERLVAREEGVDSLARRQVRFLLLLLFLLLFLSYSYMYRRGTRTVLDGYLAGTDEPLYDLDGGRNLLIDSVFRVIEWWVWEG